MGKPWGSSSSRRSPEPRHGHFRNRLSFLIPALTLLLAPALPVEDAKAQTTCPEVSGDNGSGAIFEITGTCTITSTGKVRRSGGNAAVQLSGNARLTIEKGGLIERTGTGGAEISALRFNAQDLTAVNRGTIRSTGNQVHAVNIAGSNANDGTFENWGTVETQGRSSKGIRIVDDGTGVGGERNTVINRGLISTQGDFAYGIENVGANTKITNFGRILTSGNGSAGILSTFDDSVITLEAGSLVRSTGTVSSGSFPTNSFGIAVSATNPRIDIRAGATVEVTGDKATVVRLRINNGTLTIGGTVRATGSNSFGVDSNDAGGMIDIKAGGLVEATGDNSSALYFGEIGEGTASSKYLVGIGGEVRATGLNSYAIRGLDRIEKITLLSTAVIRGQIHLGSNSDILTIRPGARIFGRIHMGGGTDVLKYGEAGKEVSFKRGEKRHFLTDAKGKRSQTFKYTVYGVQGASGDTEPAVIRASDVDSSTGPAMLRAMAGDAAHAVQGAIVSEALSGIAGRNGWVSVSGDSRRQKGEEFDHKRRNLHLVGGVEMMAAENWQVGFAAGAWNGKASADSASIQAKGSGAGAGFYTGYSFGDFTVSGSLLAGRNKYEARRSVLLVNNENDDDETETAVGSSKGKWIGASIGAATTGRYALDFFEGGWSLRPQVVASWVRLEQDEIMETGATELNLKTKARKDRILVLDGEVGIARPFAEGSGEVELLTGITYQRRTGDNVASSLDNSKLDQAIDQGGSETDVRLGVDVRYALSASSELDFGVDYSKGKDKASGYSAALAFRIGF